MNAKSFKFWSGVWTACLLPAMVLDVYWRVQWLVPAWCAVCLLGTVFTVRRKERSNAHGDPDEPELTTEQRDALIKAKVQRDMEIIQKSARAAAQAWAEPELTPEEKLIARVRAKAAQQK